MTKILIAIAVVALGLGIWNSVKDGFIQLGTIQERSRIQEANVKAGAAASKEADERAGTATQRARKIDECQSEKCVVDGVDGLYKK